MEKLLTTDCQNEATSFMVALQDSGVHHKGSPGWTCAFRQNPS